MCETARVTGLTDDCAQCQRVRVAVLRFERGSSRVFASWHGGSVSGVPAGDVDSWVMGHMWPHRGERERWFKAGREALSGTSVALTFRVVA